MVAVIEVARTETKNPPIPDFLHNAYYQAIQDLAELGAKQISQTKDPETVRAILSIIPLSRGARTHGRFLINYSEEELLDLENRAS